MAFEKIIEKQKKLLLNVKKLDWDEMSMTKVGQ